MAVSVLYGLYTPEGNLPDLSKGVSALYNATSRTAWGISVAWVIFACATGYGGIFSSFHFELYFLSMILFINTSLSKQ
jgi:hypothetical protein